MARAQIDVEQAESNFAARQYTRSRDLVRRGAISEQEAEIDLARRLASQAELAGARAQVAQAQSAIEAAQAEADRLRAEIRDSVLVAPIRGRIETRLAEPGEVLGFLGPNGAGKSTTMRMLAGFITPSGGSASICGHDVVNDPIAARTALGYLPEGAPHYAEMTVGGFLDFIADLRGLKDAHRKTRLDYVIGRLQLDGVIAQTIDTLSKGFKRRVGLAQAIVHDPQVLILDEPTDGLDPLQKHEVRTLIGEIAREKTIVISTHILEEVDAVCTRAIIIARGKLVADDTPAALRARAPSGRLDDVFRAVAA